VINTLAHSLADALVCRAIAIKHLEALAQSSDGRICVCYIFFRYSDRSEMTVRTILEVLVMQTLERHPECLALIEKTYAQHLNERTEPNEEQLLLLLRRMAESMAVTFYFLDALDEAPTKIQLRVVRTLASLDVKLFVTSRPLKPLESRFPRALTFTIVAQDGDLDIHIAKEIEDSVELRYLLQREPGLMEELVSTVKKNCGGMYEVQLSLLSNFDSTNYRFLHASLQLDALCGCVNAKEVRRTLEGFPSRIEQVYLRTWERILKHNSDHITLVKFVLVWVLNSSRSMTIDELERAVATCSITHKYEAGQVVPGAILMSICQGLVVVEEESHMVRLVRT
jgi:hypothetical protein